MVVSLRVGTAAVGTPGVSALDISVCQAGFAGVLGEPQAERRFSEPL